jgi:alanine-synthesizing transaminase
MRFSDLTVDFPGATNRLYERLEELRQSGIEIVDLVSANVNDHGIVFPHEQLDEIWKEAAAKARVYRPDSLGQRSARDAISNYEGASTDNIILTPGTSVSYWYAFKLLCEPGDEVLCPKPSYPLFDYIARLAGVEIRHYRLDEERDWGIDFDSLEQNVTERTRAIVLISPHNPTGMVADREQVEHLITIAARNKLPIVSDEVFREFVYDGEAVRPSDTDAPLVFTLNGFSKMFALPGVKIGWMAISGEPELVNRSLKTLELISDTFLPVNETAQFAVPAIFEEAQGFLTQYRNEIGKRRDVALSALESAVHAPPRGGFHIVAPCRRDIEEEDLAVELLESEHVLVHPGYFYDIEGRHIVMSFVRDRVTLEETFPRVTKHLL